ncbi:MAG TPA: hypothetical protein VLC47_01585 [Burkholderiales bacterium]|nr:hypothetical protein [Burkholderiales bacterium]
MTVQAGLVKVLAGIAVAACACAALAHPRETPTGAKWAVDPAAPGPDLPPAGRSLFDFVATVERDGGRVYDLPFPFEALAKRIEARAGCTPREPCARAVLIPLGRSLQRTAAAPDFFESPRIVIAFDGEPAHGAHPLLKDRLYLGYQERSNAIEVISWNEPAGRFEFQVVRDYRPGGKPEVLYARRAVCAACHQNLAPIFSRQTWEETNANPRVVALLKRDRIHGVVVRRGVDVPDAIDAATDRANLYTVSQRLWQEACPDARCRAALLAAALQFRLTGERAFDERASGWREAFVPAFAAAWRLRWPGGLAIPNPDIPNRDPFGAIGPRPVEGVAATHVAARFEPLAPRLPLAVWSIERPETGRQLVAGIAAHLADADVRALDGHFAARATRERTASRRYESSCEMARTDRALRFKCVPRDPEAPNAIRFAGRVELRGTGVSGGEVGSLVVAGAAPLEHFGVVVGAIDAASGRLGLELGADGMRARLADGAAIARVELRWKSGEIAHSGAAEATVIVVDDFAPVRDALAVLAAADDSALAAKPFGRARVLAPLFARLGIAPREWCCEDAGRMPPAVAESAEPPVPVAGPAKAFAPFYPLCAGCHATGDRFPPNFLAGSGERVAAAVRHCAPRIYARLAMSRVAPAAREKTPMPPEHPLPQARDDAPSAASAAAGGLESIAAALLRAESGAEPRLARLLEGGYEGLRPCLPEEGRGKFEVGRAEPRGTP